MFNDTLISLNKEIFEVQLDYFFLLFIYLLTLTTRSSLGSICFDTVPKINPAGNQPISSLLSAH